MQKLLKTEHGSTLVIAILAMLVLLIIVPFFVKQVEREARWSVKSNRSSKAFHLAEAAVERGLWKLKESNTNWITAASGVPIAGYDGSVVYNDIEGGSYKIVFSPGPQSQEATITGIGRDNSAREVRTIQVVYGRGSFDKAWSCGGSFKLGSGVLAHWGPVTSYTSITTNLVDIPYYPKKYSAGPIETRDVDPNTPNSDNIEYWAYQDLGSPSQVDIDHYREIAKNSQVPNWLDEFGNPGWTADPPGSGYITTPDFEWYPHYEESPGVYVSTSYTFISSTSAIFIEGKVNIKDVFLATNYLSMGNTHLHNVGITTTAVIPVGARSNYDHPNAEPVWNAEFASVGGEGGVYEIDNVVHRGFFYIGGDWNCGGGDNSIIGAGFIEGRIILSTLTLYYDPTVAQKVKMKGGELTRISWKEAPGAW